jgi:hypothetical protein
MHYIEALQTYQGTETSLFLAGGITNCPHWQIDLVARLQDVPLVLLNPRRTCFPIEEPNAAHEQIAWEYAHLRQASAIAFWFPGETLCPITLYELGAWSMTEKKLFVGVHPKYERREDVGIQTALVRPDIHLVATLAELAQQIVSWVAR